MRLPADVEVIAMRELAFRMAELSDSYRLSSLGAEAVAAAERLGARVRVWDGDDGPQIRAAMTAVGIDYQPLAR